MQAISYQTFTFMVSCDSIIDFLANVYFIVQIYHAKSFKMKCIRSLYLNFLLKIFIKTLKSVVQFNMHKMLLKPSFWLETPSPNSAIYIHLNHISQLLTTKYSISHSKTCLEAINMIIRP